MHASPPRTPSASTRARRGRRLLFIMTTGLLAGLLCAPAVVCAGGFKRQQRDYPRFRTADQARSPAVEQQFRDAGAKWPPRVFLRAFKLEGELELWAAPRSGTDWVKVRTFPVCARSGALGPKRRQGDLQVPEGFYRVDRFNPASRFHLSLGIDYPNAVDRARQRSGAPLGGDIFIHGDCVTIGCLPLRDGPMEDLYVGAVAAWDAGHRTIPVHIFPCRFGTDPCTEALGEVGLQRPADAQTWPALMPGYWQFETDRVPPRVRATPTGYRVRTGRRATRRGDR